MPSITIDGDRPSTFAEGSTSSMPRALPDPHPHAVLPEERSAIASCACASWTWRFDQPVPSCATLCKTA